MVTQLNGLPKFTDTEYWDEQLQNYADSGAHSMHDNGGVWDYFKYCIRTQNRFFFKNPLLPIILARFEQNTFLLKSDMPIYRARIDHNEECVNQCWLAGTLLAFESSKTKDTPEDGSLKAAVAKYYCGEIEKIKSNPEYLKFKERQSMGFEGFDASGSGSAPSEYVTAGRCNPKNVSYLYAANDPHTAVAEVRPFIRDPISIATLQLNRDLRLVDFYYSIDEKGVIQITDPFWDKIRREFSAINKGTPDGYLVTQFIAAMAQNAGYDGLRFRSSLVQEGTNYVIFDGDSCTPISSKMYVIPRVTYDLMAIIPE